MSLNGTRQLKELVIRYCDWGGSSRGVVAWMNKNLVAFAAANPQLQVRTEVKRNHHPVVRGHYLNGNSKTICVKNEDEEGVESQIFHLRNQIGRKMNGEGYKKPVVTTSPSIQGEWHEQMDVIPLLGKLEIVHRFNNGK